MELVLGIACIALVMYAVMVTQRLNVRNRELSSYEQSLRRTEQEALSLSRELAQCRRTLAEEREEYSRKEYLVEERVKLTMKPHVDIIEKNWDKRTHTKHTVSGHQGPKGVQGRIHGHQSSIHRVYEEDSSPSSELLIAGSLSMGLGVIISDNNIPIVETFSGQGGNFDGGGASESFEEKAPTPSYSPEPSSYSYESPSSCSDSSSSSSSCDSGGCDSGGGGGCD